MKILYIPAKRDFDVSVFKNAKFKEKRIGLVSSVQFLHKLKEIKKILERNYKVYIAGYMLGCNVKNAEKIENKVDAFIFIGSKEFHPIYLKLKTRKMVYGFDPIRNEFFEVSEKEIEGIEKLNKGKYIKFLNAEKAGIIVSLKPGQFELKRAFGIQKKLEKESYIFVLNNLNANELENFKEVDIFINTACPRIENNKIINYEEFKNFEKKVFK